MLSRISALHLCRRGICKVRGKICHDSRHELQKHLEKIVQLEFSGPIRFGNSEGPRSVSDETLLNERNDRFSNFGGATDSNMISSAWVFAINYSFPHAAPRQWMMNGTATPTLIHTVNALRGPVHEYRDWISTNLRWLLRCWECCWLW